MRSFRVFNNVRNVRVIWKLAGVRLGPFGQIAMLLLMALCLLVTTVFDPLIATAVFVVGFIAISVYATVLSRLDSTEALSERTQLALLRRGLKSRRTANFDLPGL